MAAGRPPDSKLPEATPPSTTGATPSAALVPKGRRPSPRIAQLKRTWYFLSRNNLALVGLAILIFFGAVAISSFASGSHGFPDDHLVLYCGSYAGLGTPPYVPLNGSCNLICTYPSNMPPPSPNCYAVDQYNPGNVPPTLNLAHFSGGPLPLGSLTIVSDGNLFYSIYDGFIEGAQWSLAISVSIVVTGALIGLLLGSMAGYLGGLVDELIMRVTDIFLSIPALLLVLVTLAALGPSFSTLPQRIGLLVGAFIIVWWPSYTRIVRGQVLVTREQKYVEASRASGAKAPRIVLKHIVPNSLYPVFVQLSLDVGSIPLLVGGIAFLGYHIFPTLYFPEWGQMSALAVEILPGQLTACQIASAGSPCAFPWWQLLFPGLIVFLFAISVNFLSDGLRDAFDPRLRR